MAGKIVAVAVISAAAITFAAPTHASSYEQFQSPSGNIFCIMAAFDVKPEASCEVVDRIWTPPPRPALCEGAWGNRIALTQGSAPELVCASDTLRGDGIATLRYGSTRSVSTLTCDSEVNGITCRDNSTGHFFRISRDSYELH